MSQDEMLDFVKTLSNIDRLRVLGVLARTSAAEDEIARDLRMPFREVIQHLAMLEHSGIASKQGSAWFLNTKNVENISRRQFEGKSRETYTPAPDLSDMPRKTLVSYLNADGSIKQIPHEPAKLQVILNYLLQAFTPGVIYTEKEVNTIIRRFHIDTAGLRRDMIDRGMLARKSDGSQYWRPE